MSMIQDSKESTSWDCLVIGAGPAGSTAAAVLAEKGRRVLILERETFPRYKIGESLIPYCYFPLKRIGMVDKLNASAFTKKYSVQFVNEDGVVSHPFYFFEHFDHPAAQTWQVSRAAFDVMMLENAVEKGASVKQPMRVTRYLEEEGTVTGVKARDENDVEHEFRAPVTIDASGRSTFTAARNQWKVRDPGLNKISIWTYYRGARRDPGKDAGSTTVAYVEEKNWFWFIPLEDDVVSAGVVGEKDYLYKETNDPEEVFQREVKKNEWIQDHLSTGTVCDEYRVTGDFSYRSKEIAQNGVVLTGDALAFLDPVFSSGVLLALKGGEMAGDAVDAALEQGDVSAGAFDDYGAKLFSGMESMRKLVYSFYDDGFSFGSMIKKFPDLKNDITDCLIGHLDRDYDEMFAAVSEFARLPDPVVG